MVVTPDTLHVAPSVIAGLLLAALPHLREHQLDHPAASEVIAALGGGRSQAYQMKGRIEDLLPEVHAASGRPATAKITTERTALLYDLRGRMLDFVRQHPGVVCSGPTRSSYSSCMRHFVVDLVDAHEDVPIEQIAEAIMVPPGTIQEWLAAPEQVLYEPATEVDPSSSNPDLETILDQALRWDFRARGGFAAFCRHIREHHRIDLGRTAIASILEAAGLRSRRRRGGRSPDEKATRDSFERFFPHAQWTGDGAVLPIEVDGQLHVFNLELIVDCYASAYIGCEISEVEDSASLIAAFEDAIAETGQSPIALLLDNKPSNHCEEALDAVEDADAIVIPATPYRPQNKAHVEGGFGLLKPTLSGLAVRLGPGQRDSAKSIAAALVVAVLRALNHKPRADRSGKSRAELLDEVPTDDEIAHAKAALEDRLRRQRKARETEAARQHPVVRATIAAAYQELGLDDPTGNILTATARYPLAPVTDAIAIYAARARAGNLPEDADARYLLGIARNLSIENELWAISEELWQRRVATRSRLAQELELERHLVDGAAETTHHRVPAYVDAAVEAGTRHERFFWLRAVVDIIVAAADRKAVFELAARRLSTTHHVPKQDRQEMIRFLAAKSQPLA